MVESYRGFSFRYCKDVESPGKVRVYVESQPSYGVRDTRGEDTHRNFSGGGAPPHVCVKEGCKPSTLEEARVLAHRWANATLNYIRTGEFYG